MDCDLPRGHLLTPMINIHFTMILPLLTAEGQGSDSKVNIELTVTLHYLTSEGQSCDTKVISNSMSVYRPRQPKLRSIKCLYVHRLKNYIKYEYCEFHKI